MLSQERWGLSMRKNGKSLRVELANAFFLRFSA